MLKNLKKLKVHSSSKDNIWGVDLDDMQLINIFDQKFRFSLSFIDIYSETVWVFSMKNKKTISITNAFQKILDESNCKPNKIWVNEGGEFYNRSMKSWLQDN